MFDEAVAFEGVGLGGWDVSNLEDMTGMFNNAKAFKGDVSGWQVGKVKSMRGVFKGAESFNCDLTGWDVGSCENMIQMFSGATSFSCALPWAECKANKFRMLRSRYGRPSEF